MLVRVRSCSCDLPSFVRVVCVFLSAAFLLVAAADIVWHTAFNAGSARAAHGLSAATLGTVFAVVLVFSVLGVAVNACALVGICLDRRMLMLPWLVFKVLIVIGKRTSVNTDVRCQSQSMGLCVTQTYRFHSLPEHAVQKIKDIT